MMDNEGMLSIDFLAGFSIFMIGLILVISMVPGILVGIESYNIDYDAVAYRTGVVLVEDPGWSNNGTHWEMENPYHKMDIDRIGLAISKDTPNILSKSKVEKFFNISYFTLEEIDQKLLFGDMPYSYNFTLYVDGGQFYGSISNGTAVNGSSQIPEISYGYIKRLVKVKEYSSAVIDCNSTEHIGTEPYTLNETNSTYMVTNFTVALNYPDLIDESMDPAYRIDPRYEPIKFTLRNFTLDNRSDTYNITSVSVENVRFLFLKGRKFSEIPMNWGVLDNDTYRFYNDTWHHFTLDEVIDVTDTPRLTMELYPEYLSNFATDTQFLVNFTFNYTYLNNTPAPSPYKNLTYVYGTFAYDYDDPDNVTLPELKNGVLEVAIW
jgi:hypothetical protein